MRFSRYIICGLNFFTLNPMGLSGPFLLNEGFPFSNLNHKSVHGLKWTRTTDLTLIRRAL